MVAEEKGLAWMTPIQNYLEKGMLPEDPVDARTLMENIRNYTMEDGVLYRKSYLVPLMSMAIYEVGYGHSGTPPRGFKKGEVPNRRNQLLYQMDGVERANKSLLRRIKTRLEKERPAWAEEELRLNLDLLEEKREIAAIREARYKQQELRLNLDLLEEKREIADIREARYKQQVKKYYNKKRRHVQFKLGEFVLSKNEASRDANTCKLGPTWEGPYKVNQAF
nr:hypothetical protein [Tanacetum cinerariifolium]